MKTEFSGQILDKYSNAKLLENPPVVAELFHADRRTDMMKLIVAFRNFVNAPKIGGNNFLLCHGKNFSIFHSFRCKS